MQCLGSMPERVSLGEAARMLGVSADTLRRWDRDGKVKTTATSRTGGSSRSPRCGGSAASPSAIGRTISFRRATAFPGVVRSVEVDGVMGIVELECGPHLVTAAITRDAIEQLGLEPGVEGDRDGQGNLGHGDRGVRRLALAVAMASLRSPDAVTMTTARRPRRRRADRLRGLVADRARSRRTARRLRSRRSSPSPARTIWQPRSARAPPSTSSRPRTRAFPTTSTRRASSRSQRIFIANELVLAVPRTRIEDDWRQDRG